MIGGTYDAAVVDAGVEFTRRTLVAPLHLSSGTITDAIEVRASVRVRVGERTATGWGSVFLSDIWAWPDPLVPHHQREIILKQICEKIANELCSLSGGEPQHPLELGLRLSAAIRMLPMGMPVPELARILCCSPFDAAIHDATGLASGRSSFHLYDVPVALPTADPLFPVEGACQAIHRTLLLEPIRELTSWYVIGPADSFDESLKNTIQVRGDRHFKLKIRGRNPSSDVVWTTNVFGWLCENVCERPRFIIDANEAFPNELRLLEFLQELRRQGPTAFDALWYLEQPTSRWWVPGSDMRPATVLKPVMVDEGLTNLEMLSESHQHGWSGFALKTCKGHSLCLVAAAWARKHEMLISLQDLTNPGFALVHAALFAAYVPTVNGVELNSPQFTPDANQEWLPELQDLIVPRNGCHVLPQQLPAGLGSEWKGAGPPW